MGKLKFGKRRKTYFEILNQESRAIIENNIIPIALIPYSIIAFYLLNSVFLKEQ